MNLVTLKKEYELYVKKYKLPSFDQLNDSFEIERYDRDTERLLRSLRKGMMDKIVNALSFVDMLLDPVHVARTYMRFVNNMTVDDRKLIETIYTSLAPLNILSMKCEVEYNEKAEALLIQEIYTAWENVVPSFKALLGRIEKPSTSTVGRQKTYFG